MNRVPSSPTQVTQEQAGTASVLRALQLLDVFTGDQPRLGVSDIGRRAGIPTSTVHRLLSHLVKGDSSRRTVRATASPTSFSNSVTRWPIADPGLKDVAAPFLGELFGATRMTAHLAVLDGPEVVVVDKVVGLSTYPARTVIGGRYPAVCTSLGKALLAFEPEADPFDYCGRNAAAHATLPYESGRAPATACRNAGRPDWPMTGRRLPRPDVCGRTGHRRGRAVGAISLSGAAQSFDVAANGSISVRVTAQLARNLKQ